MAHLTAINWTAQLGHRYNDRKLETLEAELKQKDSDLTKVVEANKALMTNLAKVKKVVQDLQAEVRRIEKNMPVNSRLFRMLSELRRPLTFVVI